VLVFGSIDVGGLGIGFGAGSRMTFGSAVAAFALGVTGGLLGLVVEVSVTVGFTRLRSSAKVLIFGIAGLVDGFDSMSIVLHEINAL
jgi:hypothetical protein